LGLLKGKKIAANETYISKITVAKRIEKLYRSYRGLLVDYARQIVGSKEEAEDAVNELFLRLLENPCQLKEVKSIHVYLFRSVRNNCLNYLEHKAVLRHFLETAFDSTDDTQILDEANPLSILISKETADNLEHAIESLPPKCREIFIQARFEGKSHKDIAEERGITVNTVNTQIARAMMKIRKITSENTDIKLKNYK